MDTHEARLTQRHFDLAVCQRCDLMYVATERPPSDRQSVFQDPHYMQLARTCEPWRQWNVRHHFVRKLEALERHGPRGRLVDIGCGDGLFVQTARARGWLACGLELNTSLAAEAARHDPGRILRAAAEALPMQEGTVQAATLIHVLEHLDAPASALAEARRVLGPGGLLYVAVPCLDAHIRALLMCAPSATLRRRLFRVVAELWPPDHLSHFPARTLRAELARQGFEIVDQWFVNNPFPWCLPHPYARLMWLCSTAVAPALRVLRSGLHFEVLARRSA
jgi:SAM-dependent methyltransferase